MVLTLRLDIVKQVFERFRIESMSQWINGSNQSKRIASLTPLVSDAMQKDSCLVAVVLMRKSWLRITMDYDLVAGGGTNTGMGLTYRKLIGFILAQGVINEASHPSPERYSFHGF